MEDFVHVGTLADLKMSPLMRRHTNVNGRNVSIILRNETLFCVDSVCSHMGGPLAAGDIEDICGEQVIKCPWHSYRFSLTDGKKFSKAVTFDQKTGSAITHGWSKSNESFQRIHDVVLDNNHDIWVKLDCSTDDPVPSDRYADDPHAAACMHTAYSQYFHSKRY
jgi:nitrite reductase/ring-hydroxylating ferredoxin subunit